VLFVFEKYVDLETLLKGTETLSDDGGIMAFRGSVLYHLGKYEAAIENYSRGIVIRSNDDEFVANCCIFYSFM
jgi:hypothetical protein